MNRAWIPAGALAGVSVAGLIALGPLTDSLGTQVSFRPVIPVTTPSVVHKGTVQVSVDLKQVGRTQTDSIPAALHISGGRQAPAAATPNGDAGQAGFHHTSSSSSTQTAPATSTPPTSTPATSAPKVAPVKKTPQRPASIGGSSGPNGDNGLASGGTSGSTSVGAQSGTPSNAP